MRKGLIKYILPIFLLLFLVLPKLKSQDGDPLNKTECGWYFEAMNRNMWGPEDSLSTLILTMIYFG